MKITANLAMAALGAAVALAPACGRQEPGPVVVDSVAYTPDGTLVALTNSGIFCSTSSSAARRGESTSRGCRSR